MSSDETLFCGAATGNMRMVMAALAAGADVNGSQDLPYIPLTAATALNHVGVIKVLIERGADPDRHSGLTVPCSMFGLKFDVHSGERALHIAARRGSVEITLLLLKRAHADPNATDETGSTPLLAACTCEHHNRVEVVRLLLEAGADPTLRDEDGETPLHAAAKFGIVELFDMLHTAAPATLDTHTVEGHTPLFVACAKGHESVVSRMLSLGSISRMPDMCSSSPLVAATVGGFVGVVRVLINEGLEMVGGRRHLPMSLYGAVHCGRARILLLLLAVGGEEMRLMWANSETDGRQLLHHGAGVCCPAVVSVLLKAGADEAVRDSEGLFPRDDIGVDLDEGVKVDAGKEIAIRRMLKRGPAYRARSWAWPTQEADGGDGGGDGAVVSSLPAAPVAPAVNVRIFRPKEDRKLFMNLVGRYCEKD